VVCSTCGYENKAGNRFCGMCGTPLPHRPLTAPGAQSTASLTRALAENARPIEPRASAAPPARARVDVEPRPHSRGQRNLSETSSNRTDLPSQMPGPGESRRSEPPRSGNLTPPSRDTGSGVQRSKAAPPHFDLVPEIPLQEYVRNFHYVPPSDPEEITMRGETTVLEPELPAASNATAITPVETEIAPAEATPPPSTDDVQERLGLEVDSEAEERNDRPRYLDLNEPSPPPKPAVAATPTAVPSFLGLSDVPQVEAETGNELGVEEPARGRWRIWLAAAVILVVGFLGALEWRAQVRQTNNGPVEVIKTKMWNLTHNKPAESASAESASPATHSDSASKPEMQVEPPSNPPKQNPPASTATSAAAKGAANVPNTNAATTPVVSSARVTPAPTGNKPAAGQPPATPPQSPAPNATRTPAGQNAAAAKTATTTPPMDKSKLIGSPRPGSAATPTADKAKPSPPAADDSEEAVAKKIIPGAEEMAKANNASDSAAEAVWLWKATAKGNPAAPVRLADMYVKGDGVPRSCEQAVVLLKTAATKENALARNRLASMYSSGTCVQRNRVEAYRWLSSALVANPNSEWAQQNRNLLWQQMTPEERTSAEKYR